MLRRALLVLLATAADAARAQNEDALWDLLRAGGQVVLVRHASTTPGVGDPPGMRLQDCGTQRNLSEVGRREATQVGAALRERGVPVADVISSPWCRCIDTAQLAFRKTPATHAALGNLYGRHEQEAAQVEALKKLVRAPRSGNLFLVTHGSTAYALAGVLPATGEMVILTPQERGFRLAGRLRVS